MKKLWLLIPIFTIIMLSGCGTTTSESWQGGYYKGGTNDSDIIWGPVFTNYEGCKARALEISKTAYNGYAWCSKDCHDSEAGTPICGEVVRTWEPLAGLGSPTFDNYGTDNVPEPDEELLKESLANLESQSNDIVADDGTNIGNEDVLAFLFNTEDLYCKWYSLFIMYATAPQEQWYLDLAVNGSDVPSQRALAKRVLNKMEIDGTITKLENYKAHWGDSEFSETVRVLSLAYSYFMDFLNEIMYLQSYDEFMNLMSTDFDSGFKAYQRVPETLYWDYSYFRSDIPESEWPVGEANLLNLDDICQLTMSVGE